MAARKSTVDRRARGRRATDRARTVHGARVLLPATWDDYSIVKLAGPRVDGAKFRDNVVVTRHDVPNDLAAGDALAQIAGVAQRENKTFKLIARGAQDWLAQKCAFQDSSFLEGHAQLTIHQRQIACMSAPGTLVMVTITTATGDAGLTAISKEMEFTPAAPVSPLAARTRKAL